MLTAYSFPDLQEPIAYDDVLVRLITHPRACHVRDQVSGTHLEVVVEERGSGAWYTLTFDSQSASRRWVLAEVEGWCADAS